MVIIMEVCMCKHCKKIFNSKFKRHTCDECKEKDDLVFNNIEAYLQKYPNSNALQIAESLKIDAFEIIRFIDEGRLVITKGAFEKIQ